MLLTIEITEEQHRYMKTSAALKGKSLNNYVVDKAMSDSIEESDGDEEIRDLIEFLRPRIESAKRGNTVKVSLAEIKEETMKKVKQGNDGN